jgi:hypothetical protein
MKVPVRRQKFQIPVQASFRDGLLMAGASKLRKDLRSSGRHRFCHLYMFLFILLLKLPWWVLPYMLCMVNVGFTGIQLNVHRIM